MTKEEAILCLKGMKNYARDTFTEQTDWQTSLDMAIKALDQEPCEDAVSREFLLMDLLLKAQGEKDVSIKWLEGYINSLPPVTPQEPRKGEWLRMSDLSEQDIVNNMIELLMYLSEQEDDANSINITINRNGKSLHMHFEAYTEDGEEE